MVKNGLSRELIALRAVKELREGMYVNLGVGLPTLVSQFIPPEVEVVLHSENGILGYGPIASEEEMDADLVNAGLQPVVLMPGASFFNHADSFAMIRGGHLSLTILGAHQVSETGDLANWKTPDEKVGAIGGAMDLVCGARRVMILMNHTQKSGEPRLVKQCTYPLTGVGVVNTVITDLALIEVAPEGLVLQELAPGVTVDDVQALTEPRLIISPDLHEMGL